MELLLLFATGLVAGIVDAIAGGGGLIALPALLAAGLGPVEALATNKLQGTFGTLSATLHFVRKGHLVPRTLLPAVVLTFAGAALGTITVQSIDSRWVAALIPALLLANAAYFLFSPRVGDVDAHRRIGDVLFAVLIGFGIGFYDGFFGPGTGSFFALAFVALLGFSLARATAHAKLLNLTSNAASLLFFILGGHVVWLAGLTMAAGQFVGGWIGAHLVIRRGAGLVRPVLVLVMLALVIRLLADPAHPWWQLL